MTGDIDSDAIKNKGWKAGGLSRVSSDEYPIIIKGRFLLKFWGKDRSKVFSGQLAHHESQLYILENNIMVIHVRLSQAVPWIILDKTNSSEKLSKYLRYLQNKTDHINLEGNFNRVWQVFAPKSTPILTLQILAPNVMESIHDTPLDVDIEYHGRNLFLYLPVSFNFETDFVKLEALAKDLALAAARFHDKEYANPTKKQFIEEPNPSRTSSIIVSVFVVMLAVLLFGIVLSWITSYI